jgi:hypothetical protein
MFLLLGKRLGVLSASQVQLPIRWRVSMSHWSLIRLETVPLYRYATHLSRDAQMLALFTSDINATLQDTHNKVAPVFSTPPYRRISCVPHILSRLTETAIRKEISYRAVNPSPEQYNFFRKELARTVVGFEVLTAVVKKSTIFWDITPCSPLKFNRRFGGTHRLCLQGRRISRARNQRESRWQAGC